MIKLVLIRHGESLWNKANKFTGWTDVGLSEKGFEEAKRAGQILKKHGYTFDLAFTSRQKRAIKTLWMVLEEMDLMWLPVEKSWRLNERHYGALQGENKAEMAEKVGEGTSGDEAFVQKVTKQNVRDAIANIRKHSPVLLNLERQGRLKIVGGIYNMDTGEVEFFDES